MKQIKIFKAGTGEAEPYIPINFVQNGAFLQSSELLERLHAKSSKKSLRELAQRDGVEYDEEKIQFAKKIMRIALDEINNGK